MFSHDTAHFVFCLFPDINYFVTFMFNFNKIMYEKIPVCREFEHTQSKEEKTERKKEKAKANEIPVTLGKNELLSIFMSTWIRVMLQCRFR